jgi:hypothetical protein
MHYRLFQQTLFNLTGKNHIPQLKLIIFLSFLSLLTFSCTNKRKNRIIYDFDFAELTIEYLESGDTSLIDAIAETGGAKHIYIFRMSGERLWYRVGAKIAREIEAIHGREFLLNLMYEEPEIFIKTYLEL